MLFMHIVDDYYLQGVLAQMKQKSWWEKNHPDPMYKNDYKVALAMHAFSWSFMVSLPAAVYMIVHVQSISMWFVCWIFVCAWNHYMIDDGKANKKEYGLVIDQFLHIIQIVAGWLMMLGMVSPFATAL